MADYKKIAPLFEGWQEALIWSCLQRCMGYAVTDSEEHPSSAEIVVGDFCFFAGTPNPGLAAKAAAPIMIPRTEAWGKTLEDVWGGRAEKATRYAIKKNRASFPSNCSENTHVVFLKALPLDCSMNRFIRPRFVKAGQRTFVPCLQIMRIINSAGWASLYYITESLFRALPPMPSIAVGLRLR